MEGTVQAMCQAGMQVWMTLEHGDLVAVNAQSFKIERRIKELEARDDLVQIIKLNTTSSTALALAYKSGTVTLVRFHSRLTDGLEAKSFAHNVLSELENKLSTIKLVSSQLCAIEACKLQKGDISELWCGCNDSAIEIISLNNVGSAKLQLISTHCYSVDIPDDTRIIQLKSDTTAHMMYALHSCGNVISCWSVCEQPVLNAVIKLTQLSSPGS